MKGANGLARARIEFSYKRKKNDRLEMNEFQEQNFDYDGNSDNDAGFENEDREKSPEVGKRKRDESMVNSVDNDSRINRNVCFICKLPGHFAKDCILTKDSCYECGEKGHLAKECKSGVREAKTLTENRVKAILSQQNTYKFITPGDKLRNIINYLNNIEKA